MADSGVLIINCANGGTIVSSGTNNGDSWAGGILGHSSWGTQDMLTPFEILNCFNVGYINGENVGGIGGYIGRWSGKVSNCYNLSHNLIGERTGGIFGGVVSSSERKVEISNMYNINDTFWGNAMAESYTVSNTGLINEDGTFPNSTPYTDLLTALNAWVNENKQTYLDTYNVELKNWVMGDNGYPTFED